MMNEKMVVLRRLIENHEHDAEQRRLLTGAEFYARFDAVYFGYPDSIYGRAVTKDGRVVQMESVLIARPGTAAVKELAAALNRVLKPYREREKEIAREMALQFQADISRLAEEQANQEIAEINAAPVIEADTGDSVEVGDAQSVGQQGVLAAAAQTMAARN